MFLCFIVSNCSIYVVIFSTIFSGADVSALVPFCPAHCYFTHCLYLHCYLWANKWWWWWWWNWIGVNWMWAVYNVFLKVMRRCMCRIWNQSRLTQMRFFHIFFVLFSAMTLFCCLGLVRVVIIIGGLYSVCSSWNPQTCNVLKFEFFLIYCMLLLFLNSDGSSMHGINQTM